MNASITSLSNMYLQVSNYAVDSKTFELQLLTHPDYPSFKSISDTYDYFGIENLVAKVPIEAISQLPENFISLLKNNNDVEPFLVRKKKGYFLVANQNLEKQKITFERLKEVWEGTILAIDNKVVNNYSFKAFKFKNVYFLIFTIIFLINLFNFNLIGVIFYNILSLIGLTLSYLIIKEELGIHNKTVTKVCEAISKKNSCRNVINSKKGKLFGFISLSDAPIIYFSLNILTVVFIGFNYSIFFFLSLLSIPIILFTLYYQKIILKQWCALCIGISTILTSQFIVLFITFNNFTKDFDFLLKYSSILVLVILVWITVKTLWIENLKLSYMEIDYFKFKRNYDLFNLMLCKEKLINNNLLNYENKVTFGSMNPKIVIDAVTNPFCGFCAETFLIYYKILNTYNSVQINFIFSVPNDITNSEMQIAVSILNIYINENKERALIAMKEWYAERKVDNWQAIYGKPKVIADNIFSILKNQQKWLITNNITNTPATFINDYYYPKVYNIDDLLHFIEDIELNIQGLSFEIK